MKLYFVNKILAKATAKATLLVIIYLAAYSLSLSLSEISNKLKSFSVLVKKLLRSL